MDVGHPDCEIEEMLQEGGVSAAEGDYGMRGELVGDASAHLPKALDHELRHGDIIFRRVEGGHVDRLPTYWTVHSGKRGGPVARTA